MGEKVMALYTVVCDYGATGEGRTLMVLICFAESPEAAQVDFGRTFDPYFAIGAIAHEGLIFDLEVCRKLISDSTQKFLTQVYNDGKPTGMINYHTMLHFNFS